MNIKKIIKQILKYSPTKNLEIERINLIRNSSISDLTNQSYTEDLLSKLGLNDEELFNFPKSLYPYCGNGLQSWQYPSQFSKFLIKLSEYNISSYLEIGAKHGGTFIIITEYLRKFNEPIKSIAVDLFLIKGVLKYKKNNSNVESIACNSQSKEFLDLIKKKGPFDLVLIDGDHSYEGCKSDFNAIKGYSKMIAFHDIVGMGVPGVIKFWNEIKENYHHEFDFFEFIDQYKEVTQSTGKTWLGLGLAVKKK